jgi:CBS-domain-containing membrane protein
MGELRVSGVVNRTVVAVRRETTFKDVVCALLATDAGAVPVVDDAGRPVGIVTSVALAANVEFHGGNDPQPLRASARARWRQARALTAGELMTTPPMTVYDDLRLSRAAARLAESSQPLLCVVDSAMRLAGVLTPTELLSVYQRSDASIEAEVSALFRPAVVSVHVEHGIVTLNGTLAFRSRAEHATYAVSRLPGVVAVHNNLGYDLDDLAIPGF